MGKIFCAWIIWNEETLIELSIKSVLPYADHFIVVDGAFKSNLKAVHSGKSESTDKTINIVKSLIPEEKLTVISPPNRFWEDECEKRNAYYEKFLELGKKGDWLFWMDGDEIAQDNVRFGFQWLRSIEENNSENKSVGKYYRPMWVWVKSIYPNESPIHFYRTKEWEGYKDNYSVDETYIEIGRRLNLLTWDDNIRYVNALAMREKRGKLVFPLQDHKHTMTFFMIWNIVFKRDPTMLLLRYERSMVERKPKKGYKWKEQEWAKRLIENMEEKYKRKIDI